MSALEERGTTTRAIKSKSRAKAQRTFSGKTKTRAAHQKSHLFLGQRRGRETNRDDSREERRYFFCRVVVSREVVEEEEFAGFLLSANVHVRVDFSHLCFKEWRRGEKTRALLRCALNYKSNPIHLRPKILHAQHHLGLFFSAEKILVFASRGGFRLKLPPRLSSLSVE